MVLYSIPYSSNKSAMDLTMNRKIKIGVMGSASGPTLTREGNAEKCQEIGKWIARTDCIMINGACPGLPHEAAKGAKKEGGFVVGVSPAFSEYEHVNEYRSPNECYDILLFSGMGFMERDIMNIRTSDGIIILGGGIGTINEFTVAYEEGKAVGVLLDTGGISNYVSEMILKADRSIPPNMVFDEDPKQLVEKLIEVIKKYPTPIHEDGRVKDVKFGKLRG